MNTEQQAAAALFIEESPAQIIASQAQEIDRLNRIITKQDDQIERLTLDNGFLSGKAINHG